MSSDAVDGLAVPTFFVNKIVAAQALGPCVRFFMAAVADGTAVTSPEVCVIWDAAALLTQLDVLADIVHAVLAHADVPMAAGGCRLVS